MKCPHPFCIRCYTSKFWFDAHLHQHQALHDGPWKPEGCDGKGHESRSFNGIVHGMTFRRDGGKCQICGKPVGNTIRVPQRDHTYTLIDDYQVHHILAVNQGGANCMANLMVVCLRCHHATFKRKTKSTAKVDSNLDDFDEGVE
jgi:hypothetical protein